VTVSSLIAKRKSTDPNAPCPNCHSAFRWLDRYGVYRCLGCHRPPSRILVSKIEVLINWGLPGVLPGWETHWEPPLPEEPFYDVFAGRCPPGWFFAAANFESGGCRHKETRATPCRNGEWLRIECVACGRPLEIVDNKPPAKERKKRVF